MAAGRAAGPQSDAAHRGTLQAFVDEFVTPPRLGAHPASRPPDSTRPMRHHLLVFIRNSVILATRIQNSYNDVI